MKLGSPTRVEQREAEILSNFAPRPDEGRMGHHSPPPESPRRSRSPPAAESPRQPLSPCPSPRQRNTGMGISRRAPIATGAENKMPPRAGDRSVSLLKRQSAPAPRGAAAAAATADDALRRPLPPRCADPSTFGKPAPLQGKPGLSPQKPAGLLKAIGAGDVISSSPGMRKELVAAKMLSRKLPPKSGSLRPLTESGTPD